MQLQIKHNMETAYSFAESNIRKTYLLFIIFTLVVLGIGYFMYWYYGNIDILIIAAAIAICQSMLAFWASDKIILQMNQAVQIEKKESPEIYNIVENEAMIVGIPTPKIYIINDPSPNAFATGRNEKNSAIALNTGLIQKLNKQEIEAVVAHELSHIKNRDTLVSAVAIVLVGLIAIVADIFWRMGFLGFGGRRRSSNESSGGAESILFIVGLVFIILSPIVAKLMQLAISRKREFLADSSAVLITRYPDGMVSALEKISEDKTKSTTARQATESIYLVNPFKDKDEEGFFDKLFSTHPTIKERVEALRKMGSAI